MKKILIIDYEPQILMVSAVRLKANGYDVVTALSGEQGLAKARKEIPDLVLLDQVMPEMNGAEVLERLKDDPITKHIPVIIFTADVHKVKAAEFHARGAAGCFYKPFISEDLLAKVKEILNK